MTAVDNRAVLLVDGANMFMRSYAAYPQMTANGEQIGGAVGFLKTLRRIVQDNSPKAVYVVWESGGNSRRRAIFKDYKANRRPIKLNRFYEDDIPDTDENRVKQTAILVKMLMCVPVCQVYVPDCEGDDVVAYLAQQKFLNERKVIVSSDKDFYQLLDDKTQIYSLHRKEFVQVADVIKEFNVTPNNFALAKCICGDTSDNVPGIRGFGFKTIAKKFPTLGGKETVLLDDVISYAHARKDEGPLYTRLAESGDELRRNWRLVHLDTSCLAASQITRVDHMVDSHTPVIDKVAFMRRLIEFGITEFDVEGFFYTFRSLPNTVQRVGDKHA